MAAISNALKEAGVPPTYGFTNGGFAENEPAWRASGQVLGNHTWSHMNLNENALAAWQADLLRGEAVIAPLMTDGDWHWLRYPYLAEGETPDKWQAARRFLAGHGYRIARSEEHTSELQSLMTRSYAGFCLQKKKNYN